VFQLSIVSEETNILIWDNYNHSTSDVMNSRVREKCIIKESSNLIKWIIEIKEMTLKSSKNFKILLNY